MAKVDALGTKIDGAVDRKLALLAEQVPPHSLICKVIPSSRHTHCGFGRNQLSAAETSAWRTAPLGHGKQSI